MKNLLKSLLPESLKLSIKDSMGVRSVGKSLRALKGRGFSPDSIIDIGAYKGEWSLMCLGVFPNSRILMIEPLGAWKGDLNRLASSRKSLVLQQALLGSEDKEGVSFYEGETASSVLSETAKSDQQSVLHDMRTLDGVVAGSDFEQPAFLKLDVQGYELEVLKGGGKTLRHAEVVLMEVNLLPIYKGVPTYAETIAYMDVNGFQLYDVSAFMERPLDGALWQMDAIFVRKSSPLVASSNWE